MIRIIKRLSARLAGGSQFQQLPMVPASGTLNTGTEDTEAGPQQKNSLTARLYSSASALHDLLYSDLILMLEFEDGSTVYIGTDDIPVRLKANEGDTLDIGAEHISGVR